jgi:heat-inducible transcriptional repressor
MDQRKRLILKQIVDRYIKSGEPVSSQTLLEEYGLGVSSATVRNDMNYLEKQGYIEKPYSSSGRVPTEKGYRFFVDWLLELSELGKQEQHAITEYYRFPRQEMERLLRNTAFLLANITGLVGFVLPPRMEETQLERVTLARLGPEQLLVVLVSNLGLIESQVIEARFTAAELEEIGEVLNRRLGGKPFSEIAHEVRRFFEQEEGSWIEPSLKNSFEILSEVIARESRRRLYIEGLLNMMELILERSDGGDRLGVIKLLGDERRFAEFLCQVGREGEITALIGAENPLPELHQCSIVIMGYGYSGVLGVLGPIRMDYSKAFSATRYVGNRLQTILSAAEREEVSK